MDLRAIVAAMSGDSHWTRIADKTLRAFIGVINWGMLKLLRWMDRAETN